MAGRCTLGDEASNFKRHLDSWQKLASPSLLAIAKKTTVRDYAENSDVDAEVEGWQLETDKQFSRRFFCDLGIYNNVATFFIIHKRKKEDNEHMVFLS